MNFDQNIIKRPYGLKKRDKLFFVFINLISDITGIVTIFSPSTLLTWQKMLIQNFWTFFKPHPHPGRPPVPAETKNLILSMKNDNLQWGAKRIRDELLKLGIDLHKKTIQNILNNFRRRGKIKKTYTWKKFLKAQIDSIFAMDYFTVDTVFNQRFYIFFIIAHKSREIIQFAITQHPSMEFVKQQMIIFEEFTKHKVYLIHDRDPGFRNTDYSFYNIKNVCTSVKSPNMNSIAERFVRSAREEALDHFIILNRKQIVKIIKEYTEYYNFLRPHQGINQIPKGKPPDIEQSDFSTENIRCKPLLGGLHHHYYRDSA